MDFCRKFCCFFCFRGGDRVELLYEEIEPKMDVAPMSSTLEKYQQPILFFTNEARKEFKEMKQELPKVKHENSILKEENLRFRLKKEQTEELEKQVESLKQTLIRSEEGKKDLSFEAHDLRLSLSRSCDENRRRVLVEEEYVEKIRKSNNDIERLEMARKEGINNLTVLEKKFILSEERFDFLKGVENSLREEIKEVSIDLLRTREKAREVSDIPGMIIRLETSLSEFNFKKMFSDLRLLLKHEDGVWKKSYLGYKKSEFTDDTCDQSVVPLLVEMGKFCKKLKKGKQICEAVEKFMKHSETKGNFSWKLKEITKKLEELNEKRQILYLQLMKMKDVEESCIVCMDKPKSTIFMPCKHFCCCEVCTETIRSNDVNAVCPLCRYRIKSVIKGIYQV